MISLADSLYRLANLVLAVSALGVAALIVRTIHRRVSRRVEPLGVVVALVFVAIGLMAAVRVWAVPVLPADASMAATLIVVDMVAAGVIVTCLLQRRRYGVFIETAGLVQEYETGYEQKAREARALAQVNEELRRLDQLKSEFLAMVSHELRTPLTAIIGYSRLLTRQVHGPLSARQLEHQEAIFRGAQRLSDLINDLLDVSRLEAGRVELNPRPTSVRHVVDQVSAVVVVAAQAKQIRIENAVASDLPLVNADPSRLQQVLVNLVGNSVKFSSAGGLVRRLRRPAGRPGVGVGRGRRRGHRQGGAGADLGSVLPGRGPAAAPPRWLGPGARDRSTPRRAARRRGTRRERGGKPGQPVHLHAADGPRGGADPLDGSAGERAHRAVPGRPRVLVVEDELQTQELVRVVVEDMLGGVARMCDDGEQSVREAAERPPALILLDLMLPRVSGWEVARRLRQSPRTATVPIVAVSALSRPQEREAALHAGCDAYLTKPFTPDALARVVAVTLQNYGVVVP